MEDVNIGTHFGLAEYCTCVCTTHITHEPSLYYTNVPTDSYIKLSTNKNAKYSTVEPQLSEPLGTRGGP